MSLLSLLDSDHSLLREHTRPLRLPADFFGLFVPVLASTYAPPLPADMPPGWIYNGDWFRFEPRPGEFDWRAMDDPRTGFFQRYRRGALYFRLGMAPEWASRQTRAGDDRAYYRNPGYFGDPPVRGLTYPPDRDQDWVRWVDAVLARNVSHWDGRLRWLQVWNESVPRHAPGRRASYHGSYQRLARLYQLTIERRDAFGPGAAGVRVVAPSVLGIADRHFREFFDTRTPDGTRVADLIAGEGVVDIHFYPPDRPDTDVIGEALARYQSFMGPLAAAGVEGVQVISSEIGRNGRVSRPDWSELDRRQRYAALQRLLLWAVCMDIRPSYFGLTSVGTGYLVRPRAEDPIDLLRPDPAAPGESWIELVEALTREEIVHREIYRTGRGHGLRVVMRSGRVFEA